MPEGYGPPREMTSVDNGIPDVGDSNTVYGQLQSEYDYSSGASSVSAYLDRPSTLERYLFTWQTEHTSEPASEQTEVSSDSSGVDAGNVPEEATVAVSLPH